MNNTLLLLVGGAIALYLGYTMLFAPKPQPMKPVAEPLGWDNATLYRQFSQLRAKMNPYPTTDPALLRRQRNIVDNMQGPAAAGAALRANYASMNRINYI